MSDARKEIREALDAAGYAPPEGAEGGLRDHRSKSRLDLILTQNVRRARGYARRAADMTVLDVCLARPGASQGLPAQCAARLARALIRRGAASSVDPDGNKAGIGAKTVAHWERKYKPGETRRRLATIRRAFDAVREPQETWERKGRKYYLKATADADGRMTYTYVVAKDGEIETWVSNSKTGTAANKRGGNLLQRQGE